jgi:hypothetical protein
MKAAVSEKFGSLREDLSAPIWTQGSLAHPERLVGGAARDSQPAEDSS